MMTVEDIHNITFDRSMRGYRQEDVDKFLTQMAQDFEQLTAERDTALAEKDAAIAAAQQEKDSTEQKLYVLADKIEQYRQDEENLKTALLNAQRLGETVVHEAKQKADTILYDAKSKANQIQEQAKENVAAEEKKLASIQSEVSKFKGTILGLYKQHIEALSALPSTEKDKVSTPIFFSGEDAPEKQAERVKTAEQGRAAKSTRRVKETRESEAEQETFNLEDNAPQSGAKESFENFQGIQFDS